MARPNLLPCPFCGGKVYFVCTESASYGQGSHQFAKVYRIECPKCGATNYKKIIVPFDYSPEKGPHADETDLQKAIDTWNTRVEAKR